MLYSNTHNQTKPFWASNSHLRLYNNRFEGECYKPYYANGHIWNKKSRILASAQCKNRFEGECYKPRKDFTDWIENRRILLLQGFLLSQKLSIYKWQITEWIYFLQSSIYAITPPLFKPMVIFHDETKPTFGCSKQLFGVGKW